MKKQIAIVLCVVAINGTKAQMFNPLLADMLQDTLDTYVASIPNIKGMSASVLLPGQGIWQGTVGVSFAGQPITPDMEFGIASNTKLFVAAAILLLDENNTISLDDSLHTWLPTHTNVNPNITIRQLLNHTSGVSDPIFIAPLVNEIMANPTQVFTPDEVLSYLGAPLFAAGTGWGYSNVNYILAGMVAQSATGFHISEIIRDSILTPLALNNTFYDVEEPEVGTIAHRWFNTIDYSDTSRVGLNTAGGCAGALFSTSADMVNWYHALMNGQILDAQSFAELTDFIDTPATYDYGLGLESRIWYNHPTWGHGGSTWGYKSKMLYDPCMNAVVCGLTNSWPAGSDAVVLKLFSVLVNHLPQCGAIISGPENVAQGDNAIIYTVTEIPNATSYVWTLPEGASGTSSTNSISVDYSTSAVSGDIEVVGINEYGNGAPSTLAITVNELPPAPCPGDFNFDGTINTSDLLLFMSGFGCVAECASDMNNDGNANTSDLLLFMALYGSICL
ncbi:MAG: serine hydrolase [Flavobacteriales bacterium]|nr:serine hydrolase [Flavobacteriales bacterium]